MIGTRLFSINTRALLYLLAASCAIGLSLMPMRSDSPGDTRSVQRNITGVERYASPGQPMAMDASAERLSNLDYDKLRPADFVLTAASFDGNQSYGQAMLLIDCENHRKTRQEIDATESRQAAMRVDPSGQYLKQLEFDRKVKDEQCKDARAEDTSKIANLMATAAEQGDPHARAWIISARFELIKSALATLEDSSDRAERFGEAQALLPQLLTLAEQGESQAALLASNILATDFYGAENVAESARWILVATNASSETFKVSPMTFQSEPYNSLSPQQIALVTEQAQRDYLRCCAPPVVDAGASPFSLQ